jgi:hypothetical protein
MLNVILITTFAQLLPVYEEEINLPLPENYTIQDKSSIIQKTINLDDSSGDVYYLVPKKGKKVKVRVTDNLIGNMSGSFQEDSPDTVATKVFIAGVVGMVCIGLLAGLYSITKRRRGYQKITHTGGINNYGSLVDGTW